MTFIIISTWGTKRLKERRGQSMKSGRGAADLKVANRGRSDFSMSDIVVATYKTLLVSRGRRKSCAFHLFPRNRNWLSDAHSSTHVTAACICETRESWFLMRRAQVATFQRATFLEALSEEFAWGTKPAVQPIPSMEEENLGGVACEYHERWLQT